MDGVYDSAAALPEGWKRIRLGDALTVIRGASPRPKGDPRYFGGSIPWIMISDITKEKGKFLSRTTEHVTPEGANKSRFLPAGTLILSNSGTVCVPKILAVDGCIHDGFVAFPNLPDDFDILYLYYYFDFIRPRIIDAHRQGITQVNLNTQIVKNIRVPIAPIDQQRDIVVEIEKQFSRLDEAVANLNRGKANLKRYKAAILKAAVEGRLVEAEAELARRKGRPYETAAQFLIRLLDLRRQHWTGSRRYREPGPPETSDLAALPEGWAWTTVGALLSRIEAGKSFRCEERQPTATETGVAKVSAVSWGEYDEAESKTCIDETRVNAQLFIRPGDFLFSRANTIELVGACVVAHRVTQHVMLSDKILRLSVLDNLDKWLMYSLRSPFGRSEIERLATGNQESMRNISQDRILQIRIALPPSPEINRIVAEIERQLSAVTAASRVGDENGRRADHLRKTILASVFCRPEADT